MILLQEVGAGPGEMVLPLYRHGAAWCLFKGQSRARVLSR